MRKRTGEDYGLKRHWKKKRRFTTSLHERFEELDTQESRNLQHLLSQHSVFIFSNLHVVFVSFT